MLYVSIGVGAAEGASLLRRGTSWSAARQKLFLQELDFPWDNLPTARRGQFSALMVGRLAAYLLVVAWLCQLSTVGSS